MESPRDQNDPLTPSQRQAVAARGNVLVMAGAGTGKTTRSSPAAWIASSANARRSMKCSSSLSPRPPPPKCASASAARLKKKSPDHRLGDHRLGCRTDSRSLTLAHIGTLHSFCLRLVREHFHELGLDPQLAMLDEGEARQLASETLDEQFQAHYAGEDEFSLAVQNLIQIHGSGRDEKIRALILRLHHYSQTRPDAAGWLAEQIQKFSAAEPAEWRDWLLRRDRRLAR